MREPVTVGQWLALLPQGEGPELKRSGEGALVSHTIKKSKLNLLRPDVHTRKHYIWASLHLTVSSTVLYTLLIHGYFVTTM